MIAMIICVVAVFSTVMVVNINSSKQKLNELRATKSKLEAQYNEELKLSEKLKEKEVYVQTNAYIEEQARKMGLVYPDEVIFKPED